MINIRGLIVLIIILPIIIGLPFFLIHPAHSSEITPFCPLIREAISHYGEEETEKYVKEKFHITDAQIKRAIRECKIQSK